MARPLCPAGEELQVWLDANGVSQTAFAEELGYARSVLWRWMVAEHAIHIDAATRIERRTGIPASRWATDAAARDEKVA